MCVKLLVVSFSFSFSFDLGYHFTIACTGHFYLTWLMFGCLRRWSCGLIISRWPSPWKRKFSFPKLYVYMCVYVLFLFLPTHFYLLYSLYLWSIGKVPGPPYFPLLSPWFFLWMLSAHVFHLQLDAILPIWSSCKVAKGNAGGTESSHSLTT